MGSPFDSGKTLIFKSMSDSGPKRYLNSWPASDSPTTSVYLSDSTNYNSFIGTHWEVNRLSTGIYSLRTQSTSGSKRYLNSWPAAPSVEETVYLTENVSGNIGTNWEPQEQADGSYTLKSQSTSGSKRYLNSWPSSDSVETTVYLSDNTDPDKNIGTHWMVGVDWYTAREVQDILQNKYPGVQIKFYPGDRKYVQMEYSTLKSIWDSSGLKNYNYTVAKFDCDDFAVCYKAAVSKWCYGEETPANTACLCGIIWGNDGKDAHAFNFSVDAFGNLVLLEPQTGGTIALDKWTPYLCMF